MLAAVLQHLRLLRRPPAIAACSSSMHERPPFHACLTCQCADSCMPRPALRACHAAAASRPHQHQQQPSQRQRNNLEPGGNAFTIDCSENLCACLVAAVLRPWSSSAPASRVIICNNAKKRQPERWRELQKDRATPCKTQLRCTQSASIDN